MHKNKDFGFTLFFTYNIHFVTQNGSSTFSTNLAFAKVTTSHPYPSPHPTQFFPEGEHPGLAGHQEDTGTNICLPFCEMIDVSAEQALGLSAVLCSI